MGLPGAAALIVLATSGVASARSVVLVPAGAGGWHYHALELPALLDDPLERVAVLGASTVSSTAGAVAGAGRTSDWARRDEGEWLGPARAPFASRPRDKSGDCECATPLGGRPDMRVAALKLRRRFDIGDLAGLRALNLRVRYQDGIVVFLNGVQIAQRLLSATGPVDVGAQAAHGPEWESFSIPVVPWLLKSQGNVLAVEVRPSEARGVMFDLELGASDVPHVLVPPFVTALRPRSALIVMETDLPATVQVLYGDAGSMTRVGSARTPGPTRHHEIDLTGLGPETHYQASIMVGGRSVWASAEAVLHAPPGAGEPIRFAVYGDTRGGHAVHQQIVSSIAALAPDFVLTTGDMVARGHDEADWQRLTQILAPLARQIPVYPAIGNHEWGLEMVGVTRFRQLFAQAAATSDGSAVYYSYDVADLHLVFLDSNAWEHQSQLEWLEADLAAARKRQVRAIFALCHNGPVSRGPHAGHLLALERYVPVLQKYKVAALFSGHDHDYERGMLGGLQYVVSGGGGAPLYNARCGRPGQRACKDSAQAFFAEHHYVTVEVMRDSYQLCAFHPDGTPLEKCVTSELAGRKRALSGP